MRLALLVMVQLCGAVDGPVTKRAETGELEWARGDRVVEEVADESWSLRDLCEFEVGT